MKETVNIQMNLKKNDVSSQRYFFLLDDFVNGFICRSKSPTVREKKSFFETFHQ